MVSADVSDDVVQRIIDEWVRVVAGIPYAVLIDVRRPDEFVRGHIPGSVNVPLDRIADVEGTVHDPGAPIFVYCRSGSRSGTAAIRLRQMGYTDVTNIGGIMDFTGRTESCH